MDRILNRRALMIGAGAVAATPLVSASNAAKSAEIPAPEATPRHIKAFLVGTTPNPLGVALEIYVSDGLASVDVHPMMFKSDAGCVESTDPAVCAFLMEVVARINAESERTRTATANFLRPERAPRVSGEWIECPACLGFYTEGVECQTCLDRGSVWNSFREAVTA